MRPSFLSMLPLVALAAACGTSGGALDADGDELRGGPDFALQIAPGMQTLAAGGTASFTVSAQARRGFSGAVALSFGALPAGATAGFSGALQAGGSVTAWVATSSATPLGTHAISIAG